MKPTLKPIFVIFSLFAIIMAIAAISDYRQSQADAKELMVWQKDISAALSDASKLYQPVFIDFTASWCGPCQQMKRTTFADPAVKKALDRYATVQVDLDQQHAVAEKYKVDSIPTFIILSENGEVINRRSGYLESDRFLSWLGQ